MKLEKDNVYKYRVDMGEGRIRYLSDAEMTILARDVTKPLPPEPMKERDWGFILLALGIASAYVAFLAFKVHMLAKHGIIIP